jgi:hypothetical protein
VLYQVDILDSSLNFKATVRTLVALDNVGTILEYTRKLSDFGQCRFRVGTQDPLFTSEGDLFTPFAHHVRIRRGGVTVWQGVIVKNPQRNIHYVEVVAYTYLYLLSRTLIRHDAASSQGAENYLTLKSGTLASQVQTLITNAAADGATTLSTMTNGTVNNPTFPADFKDSAGTALSGSWTFSDTFQLKFDYRDVLYCLQTLGVYANYDFELTDGLVFNFKSFIGNKQPNLVFYYGTHGNIEDFNAVYDGNKMANFLQGVAADNDFNILHAEQSSSSSIATYGKLAAVAAYADVKNVNLLLSRLRQELDQVSTPNPEIHLVLNEHAYPLGQYGIGDTVTVRISHGLISIDAVRRIVGIDVKVNETGKDSIRLITNLPRDTQS